MVDIVASLLALIKISPRALINYCLNYFAGTGYLSEIILNEKSIYQSSLKKGQSRSGTTFLIVSFLPLPYCLKMEGIISNSLKRRGHRVVVLSNLASDHLANEFHRKIYGNEVLLLERFLRPVLVDRVESEIDEMLAVKTGLLRRLKKFEYRGAKIGLHVLATLSTDVVHGKVEVDDRNIGRVRRMLTRSAHYVDAADRVMKLLKPKLTIGIERGFVGTAEIFYASLINGVTYMQWVASHEPNSLMIKKYTWNNYRMHPFSLSGKTWENAKLSEWSSQDGHGLKNKFEQGYKEGVWFKQKFLDLLGAHEYKGRHDLVRDLGLDGNFKIAVIYSHILSDANLFYGEDIFESGFEEWMIETVKAAAECKNVNWILKIHPANIHRNAKSGYAGEYGEILALKNYFGKIPEFLKIVYPEDPLSPLSFFQGTDYAITVRGTIGIEAPVYGVTTLTAGTGRYSGLGFTVDSNSQDEYLKRIRKLNDVPMIEFNSVKLAQIFASTLFNLRPTKYGNVFKDVFPRATNHPGHRDLQFLKDNLEEALLDHQMQDLVLYIESDDEDFLIEG